MNIIVLNYNLGKIFYIRNLPFTDFEQVENFLYKKYNFNSDEISWMTVDDFYKDFTVEDYDE